MSRIEVKMLDGFEICVDGKPALTQLQTSRKATAVVEYLILQNGERVSHKMLTDALWGGERSSNPDMALRAILHRIRNMIEEENQEALRGCIVTSRGYYQWHPACECRVDVNQVSTLGERAAAEQDEWKRARLYERLVQLYTGRLLPQAAAEPWVEGVSVRLHAEYRKASQNLLELYKKWGENVKIIALCERALELDPYAERLYVELMMAQEACGRSEEAKNTAARAMAMGCMHRNVEPKRVATTYRQMRKADKVLQADMERLVAALQEPADSGAVLCGFDTFREMYSLQRGIQSRYGVPVFLGLVHITPSHGTGAKKIEEAMEMLGRLICGRLRQCDVVAQYSDTQFAVMLCGSAAESGPFERIKAAFYRMPGHERFLLSYTMYAPESIPATPNARGGKNK